MDKKEWEKPELEEIGLDLDNCCNVPVSPQNTRDLSYDPNEGQYK